jgi:hypothetical protein
MDKNAEKEQLNIGAVSTSLITEWQDLETHPKNSKWVEGLRRDGSVVTCHYACNLSGEDQPPFKGFFKRSGDCYMQVDIVKWLPLNEC